MFLFPFSNQKMLKWRAAGRPKVIFAEGDSWFDYPVLPSNGGMGFNYDLLWQLHELGEWLVPLSKAGDCLADYVGNVQMEYNKKILGDLHRTGVPIKGVIVSGGGNDLVGPTLQKILKAVPGGSSADDFINKPEWDAKFAQVEVDYGKFIQFCTKEIDPNVRILGHTYDYVFPNGKAYKAAGIIDAKGPWIQNYLLELKIPVPFHRPIVIKLIDEFAGRLKKVKATYSGNFDFCDFRGMLPSENQWVNELHPTAEGFEILGNVFYGKIRSYFKLGKG
jgi:hypothetical protein